jgi:hypothetical protein
LKKLPSFEGDLIQDEEINYFKQKGETGWHFLISHILSEENSLKEFGFDLSKCKSHVHKHRVSK